MKPTGTDTERQPSGKARTKGLLVQADDLAAGRFYAVHSVKGQPSQTHPIFGQSFQIKAMNLPFIVGEMVGDPTQRVTFDCRYLSLMPVTKEYVEAQRPDTSHVP